MTNSIEHLFSDSIVIDFETTSIDFREAEIIQYAGDNVIAILEQAALNGYDDAVTYQFYKPDEPVTPKISSVTCITNRMLEGMPRFKDHQSDVEKKINEYQYLIAHNAYYEEGVLKTHGMKFPQTICTMRFAKKLYKDNVDISEFNLTFLRYALDLPIPDHIRAHLAHEDAMVTALLFIRLVDDAVHAGIIDPAAGDVGGQIVSWLDEPIIIETMQFGKHKGKKLTEVPLDYWQWAMDNMNSLNEEHPGFDADFAASVTIAIEEILENQGA